MVAPACRGKSSEVALDRIVQAKTPLCRELEDRDAGEHLRHRVHLEARRRRVRNAVLYVRQPVSLEQHDLAVPDHQHGSGESVPANRVSWESIRAPSVPVTRSRASESGSCGDWGNPIRIGSAQMRLIMTSAPSALAQRRHESAALVGSAARTCRRVQACDNAAARMKHAIAIPQPIAGLEYQNCNDMTR